MAQIILVTIVWLLVGWFSVFMYKYMGKEEAIENKIIPYHEWKYRKNKKIKQAPTVEIFDGPEWPNLESI